MLLFSYSQCDISFHLFGSSYWLLIKFYNSLCSITCSFRLISRFLVSFETIVNFVFSLITFSVCLFQEYKSMHLTFAKLAYYF